MPPEPALLAETRAWLKRAAEDLRAAEVERAANPPVSGDIVFHAQQASEKALKGFLVWHGKTFRKTHSLEELGEQCLKLDPNLKHPVDEAVPLTEYAWKFHYPGEIDAPSVEECDDALEKARNLFWSILQRLPAEARP